MFKTLEGGSSVVATVSSLLACLVLGAIAVLGIRYYRQRNVPSLGMFLTLRHMKYIDNIDRT